MEECSPNSLIQLGDGIGQCARAWCNRWTCDPCAERKKRECIEEGSSGLPNRFITLTIQTEQAATADEAADLLVHAWQCLLKRWRRANPGKTPEYYVTFEATKVGWPHLHILWRGSWFDQRWASAVMAELINSPIVDVRKVYNRQHAARYLAKYLGKAPGKFGTHKRHWRSQHYRVIGKWMPEPAPPGMRKWQWVRQSFEQDILDLIQQRAPCLQVERHFARWGAWPGAPCEHRAWEVARRERNGAVALPKIAGCSSCA